MNRSILLVTFLMLAAADGAESAIDPAAGKQIGVKIATQKNEGFELEGNKTNSWGYVIFPGHGLRDMQIKGTFKILQAGKEYSPPTPYWPLTYHYLADEPGYDFAIIVRSENPGVFYRVQFSTKWDEVSLWKEGEPGADPEAPSIPSGFFAAVRTKADVSLNSDYKFLLKVIGNKLEFSLDGKPMLSYEDKILPLEKGGWGMGVFHGAGVRITGMKAEAAAGTIKLAPQKRPDFQLKNWRRSRVIFDGDEPVARLAQGTAAWLTDVKFKPGYWAQLAWPFLFDNASRASVWEMDNIICKEDAVVATAAVRGKGGDYLDGKGMVTLSYDGRKDLYCYELDTSVTFKMDADKAVLYHGRNMIYYANIYAYNPMRTSEDELKANFQHWATASSPYRMALVKGADGATYRWPIHHYYGAFAKPRYSAVSGWMLWKNIPLARDSFL